ncbi:phosphoenolpyruvate--protein phosphotransferase [Petroclostridium sp. X23]|uniref:phosphoenolpyruvate--protein phosphotransferase n=1 Tax=Petroclostridium sp. X23 TaxID=3045146 RepID=UPI0024AD3566|nr:phosphoenolpyruvate--protein phosphotransferase [Petroclostridium sp. X23]WHH60510.1 phosphoenolpyruvate--protein phosphotransferase [Petroclostridium sp. X23]
MQGSAASPGISVAKAYLIHEPHITIEHKEISQEQIRDELDLLHKAIEKSKLQLEEVYHISKENIGEDKAEIMMAHIAMIEDPVLAKEIESKVMNQRFNAVWAVKETIDEQAKIFEMIDDPYIRERAEDLKDIGNRILKNILGIPFKDLSNMIEDVILVGEEISPSMLAAADTKHVKGIISEGGGITSHTAILARNMDIPAVFGLKGVLNTVKDGVLTYIDGNAGVAEFDIDSQKVSEIRKKINEQMSIKEKLKELVNTPSSTIDGHVVEIAANIGVPEDVARVIENGAEGIGLFRTEFVYMHRSGMPTEEEQFFSYKQVLQGMNGKPVIIRTLDVGGDKEIPYFNLPKEENPFLGFRAIRICLEDKDMFKAQLRAILRASAYGKARIMYPMISSVDEVLAANKILEEAKRELKEKKIEFDEQIQVGVMVEIPSAAINADMIAKHVDFFSIGTNDLTQYTLAVDRGNRSVSKIYNSLNPAVLRLIQGVIDISHKMGKFTGMCGELAGDPKAAILLLGMGLDEFSVSTASILKIRKIITSVDMKFAKNVRDEVFKFTDVSSVERYLADVLKERNMEYLLNI